MPDYQTQEIPIKRFFKIACQIPILLEMEQERLDALREISLYISPKFSDMPKGNGYGDITCRQAVDVITREEDIKSRMTAMTDCYRTMTDMILSLSDVYDRYVMSHRYISRKGWDEISERLGYARVTAMRFHGRALEELRGRYGDPVSIDSRIIKALS